MATILDLNDEDLYERWFWELTQDERPVNEILVASLEREARSRGFEMRTVLGALGLTAAKVWDPDLHPRGHDGRFIELLGFINLLSFKTSDKKTGKTYDMSGQRGQVVGITPDPKSPGNPTIKVRLDDPKTGKPRGFVNVKPENIEQAPEAKAELDVPDVAPETSEAPEAPEFPTSGPALPDSVEYDHLTIGSEVWVDNLEGPSVEDAQAAGLQDHGTIISQQEAEAELGQDLFKTEVGIRYDDGTVSAVAPQWVHLQPSTAPDSTEITPTPPLDTETPTVDFEDPSVKEAMRLYDNNPYYMATSLQTKYPGITGDEIGRQMDEAGIKIPGVAPEAPAAPAGLPDIIPGTDRLDMQAELRDAQDQLDTHFSDLAPDSEPRGWQEINDALNEIDSSLVGGHRDEMAAAYANAAEVLDRYSEEAFADDDNEESDLYSGIGTHFAEVHNFLQSQGGAVDTTAITPTPPLDFEDTGPIFPDMQAEMDAEEAFAEAMSAPEGGEQVDVVPTDFDKTQDHRWVLPDGSWVDYDQTDGSMTHNFPDGTSEPYTGITLQDIAEGKVPEDVLSAPDEGPAAPFEKPTGDEENLGGPAAEWLSTGMSMSALDEYLAGKDGPELSTEFLSQPREGKRIVSIPSRLKKLDDAKLTAMAQDINDNADDYGSSYDTFDDLVRDLKIEASRRKIIEDFPLPAGKEAGEAPEASEAPAALTPSGDDTLYPENPYKKGTPEFQYYREQQYAKERAAGNEAKAQTDLNLQEATAPAGPYVPKGRTDESSYDYTDVPADLAMKFTKQQIQEAIDEAEADGSDYGTLKFDYEERVPLAALKEALPLA